MTLKEIKLKLGDFKKTDGNFNNVRMTGCIDKMKKEPNFFVEKTIGELSRCLVMKYLKFFLISNTENIVIITNINPSEEYLNENLKVLEFNKNFECACQQISYVCQKNPER